MGSGGLSNGGLSVGLSAVELGLELKEGYENTIAIDSINLERRLRVLGIRTGIVLTTGATESTITLVCPKYDPKELQIRVTVYNQEHAVPITVEELKDGFEHGGQVFEEYMEWYSEGTDDAFEKYWIELQTTASNYEREHPTIILDTVQNMTLEQLQELIKKYNDPIYGSNAEIMGESK